MADAEKTETEVVEEKPELSEVAQLETEIKDIVAEEAAEAKKPASPDDAVDEHVDEPPEPAPETTPDKPPEKVDEEVDDGADKEGDDDDKFEPPPEVVDWAKQLGYKDEKIKAITEADADAVRLAGRALSKKMAQLGQKQMALEAKGSEKPATRPDEPASPAKVEADDDEALFDEFGEEGSKLVKSLIDRVGSLEGKLTTYESQVTESQKRQQEVEIDSFFASLDAETWKMFGTGQSNKLNAEGDEWIARNKVCESATQLRAGYALMNDGEEMPIGKAMLNALHMLHTEVATAKNDKPDKSKAKSKTRAKQFINQPSRRTRQAVSSKTEKEFEEDAARKIDKVYEGAGLS